MFTFASFFMRLRLYGGLLWAVLPLMASAQSLESILSQALVNDPQLLEAKANQMGAYNAMKATQAGHYPVFSVVGNQVLAREYDDVNTDNDKRFNPGVKGVLNIYSWGGINSAVERDRAKERYFYYKYDETREELGSTIGQLYLAAVRSREALHMMQQNLNRHDKIIHDLDIIVQYDVGRRSELTQAKSRRLQVESNMAQAQRNLDLALSRLARYTNTPVYAADLRVPFAGFTPDELIRRYHNPQLTAIPGYQAQAAELESSRANLKVSKASRLPSLNLEGQVTRDKKEVYLNFSWDVFDQGARYSVAQNAQTMIAAESRLAQIMREITEQSRTAETDMRQSSSRAALTKTQIAAQNEVVKSYEMQFKIARRSLIDVLDSYSELAGVELAHVAAENDFRDAALAYLRAQAQIAVWAGVSNTSNDTVEMANNTAADAPVQSTPQQSGNRADVETGDSLDNYIHNFYQNLNKQ